MEIIDITSRKKHADETWRKIYSDFLAGKQIEKLEILAAIEACNTADKFCLDKGLRYLIYS